MPDGRGLIPTPVPPNRIRLAVNQHAWEWVTFLHWSYEPAFIQRKLPRGLEVDTFDGRAWVGITPFRMQVRIPGTGVPVPGGTFPEVNVRTYVRGRDGVQGILFLHMEVTSSWFAAMLRPLGLPYIRSSMVFEQHRRSVSYRWPDTPVRIDVEIGRQMRPRWGTERELFLITRWFAYHRSGPVNVRTPVDHEPWPVHEASAAPVGLERLFRLAGLPEPPGSPIVHYAPGVGVKVGMPSLGWS